MVDVAKDGLVHLDESACRQLLRMGYVGRLGYVADDRAVIVPVNYRLNAEGQILVLSTSGGKLDAAREGRILSLQVGSEDEVYHRGWSVLASGPAEVVDDPTALAEAEAVLLRPWVRAVPRTNLIRIHPDRIEGRRLG